MAQLVPSTQADRSADSSSSAEQPPWNRRRRIVAWMSVAVSFFACLILLEVASYAYLRVVEGYDGHNLLPNQFDDYKHLQPTPNYRNTKGVVHNAQGFRRNSDVAMQKPLGTYRIFLMGGSTAYGLGSLSRLDRNKYEVLPNDGTIDHYLERFLAAQLAPMPVEVINAAIMSHYSHHHLIYLNQTILKYQPDMVIFLDGYNDYFPYKEGFDQFRDYPYRSWSHLFLDAPTWKGLAAYMGWWLYMKSHFVHVVVKQVRPYWQNWTDSAQGREHIDVAEALRNLDVNADRNFVKMVERNSLVLRHEGIVPVVALQPEIVYQQRKQLTPFEQTILNEVATSWPVNFVEFKNQARSLVTSKLQQASEGNGAYFADLTDIFLGVTDDAYSDHCHLTTSGNRTLAEDLGQRLLPVIRSAAAHG